MTDNRNRHFEWAWRGFVAVGLAVIGYFVRDIHLSQRNFNEKIDRRVSRLELDAAATSGTRFTSGDWTTAKASIDERAASLDKRVTRTEDAVLAIKDTLTRMDAKLDRIEQRTLKGQP